MKRLGSMLTGQTAETVRPRSQSEAGSSAGQTGAAVSQVDTNRVAAWLSKHSPADVDKAAASRALSHGVALRVKYEGRYPTGQNGERLTYYVVAVGCDIAEGGDRKAALRDLENFMTPAPIRQIEGWLAELSVMVARRQEDAFADELRVSVYSLRLSLFPADVVKTVLLKRPHKFWPTWEELERQCQAMTTPRQHMIAAIKRGPTPKEEPRRPPTDEERARIQTMVDEMFPSQSADDRKAAVDIALAGDCMGGG